MAGQWFPSERAELEKLLEDSFKAAEQRAAGLPARKQLRGLIVPHAGLQFSAVPAASGYRLLGKPANIILLGFSHKRAITGVLAPDVEAYQTPLGELKVNREALRALGFPLTPESELCDHSLENQLPFLQKAAPGIPVIPLYVGALEGPALNSAARKLAGRIQRGDLIIASSDFTHYGKDYRYQPFPQDAELPKRLFQLAMTAFEEISSLEARTFDRYLSETGDTICGQQPIRLLMETLGALKDEVYAQAVDYMTSADLTRDYSRTVVYGTLAFYPASAYRVGAEDQQRLLRSARTTLDNYLATGKKELTPVPVEERGTDLAHRTGLFITVRKQGQMRGCVGLIAGDRPVAEGVAERTLAASSEDPRFPPLKADEGPVTIEISLLTPPRRISDWRRFQLGWGALLTLDGKSSILLPQVAREMGWNKTQFLENLATKAGLPATAYRDRKARLYVYEAQVFAEDASDLRTPAGARH